MTCFKVIFLLNYFLLLENLSWKYFIASQFYLNNICSFTRGQSLSIAVKFDSCIHLMFHPKTKQSIYIESGSHRFLKLATMALQLPWIFPCQFIFINFSYAIPGFLTNYDDTGLPLFSYFLFIKSVVSTLNINQHPPIKNTTSGPVAPIHHGQINFFPSIY